MRLSSALLCTSFLLCFSVAAQNNGPSSSGDFQFAVTGAGGSIQFNARTQANGTKGEMTFTGTVDISNEDVDGSGDAGSSATGVKLTVNIDCLRVSGNHAAMSGTVTSSTVAAYLGSKALLAVEDGGESKNPDDKFTWGVYRSTADTWLPSDAEVPGDTGATLSWYVTDAERIDDVGVPSASTKKNKPVDCQSFPFGSYAFESVAQGGGNIQVKP